MIYQGEIRNYKFNGAGTLLYPDGSKFEGYFEEGRKHKRGTFTTVDGQTQTGEWDRGLHYVWLTDGDLEKEKEEHEALRKLQEEYELDPDAWMYA